MSAPMVLLRSLNQRRSRLLKALVNSPVAFGLLILALLACGWNYLAAESSRDRVAEANAVLLETERLFSAIKDLETGERGYVLVGNERYRSTYERARLAIEADLDELQHLVHGDLKGALAGEKPLTVLVAEKRDFAAKVVAARDRDGFEEAAELVRTEDSNHVMEAISREADAIRNVLTRRVERIQASDRLRGLVLALLTGAAAWSAALLLAGLVLLRREEGRRMAALLEGVLDHAPVGLGFLDRNLTVQRMNPPMAALPGFGSANGRSIWAAMPWLEPHLKLPLEAALRRGVTTPNVVIPGTRGTCPLEMSVFPVMTPNEEGATVIEGVGLVVSDRDVPVEASADPHSA